MAGAVTVRLLHIPTLTRGKTATNVNANVAIALRVGSLLVTAVTGNGPPSIPTTGTVVVLENVGISPLILYLFSNPTPSKFSFLVSSFCSLILDRFFLLYPPDHHAEAVGSHGSGSVPASPPIPIWHHFRTKKHPPLTFPPHIHPPFVFFLRNKKQRGIALTNSRHLRHPVLFFRPRQTPKSELSMNQMIPWFCTRPIHIP